MEKTGTARRRATTSGGKWHCGGGRGTSEWKGRMGSTRDSIRYKKKGEKNTAVTAMQEDISLPGIDRTKTEDWSFTTSGIRRNVQVMILVLENRWNDERENTTGKTSRRVPRDQNPPQEKEPDKTRKRKEKPLGEGGSTLRRKKKGMGLKK